MLLWAIPFIGTYYQCPCCGWRLRVFLRGRFKLRSRKNGYCPRCHSKSRHRWTWMYLQKQTNLFTNPLTLLHVSPGYCLSRQFKKLPNLTYMVGDIIQHPNITLMMDLTMIPVQSHVFDAIICIHVLEHIEADRIAIKEIFRVLKPGGWALISVPVRMDRKTYENPSIKSPKERKQAFGEEVHVRLYGYDIVHRLERTGFKVKIDYSINAGPKIMKKYALPEKEVMFLCIKD